MTTRTSSIRTGSRADGAPTGDTRVGGGQAEPR